MKTQSNKPSPALVAFFLTAAAGCAVLFAITINAPASQHKNTSGQTLPQEKTSATQAASNVLRSCREDENATTCYTQELSRLATEYNLAYATETLIVLQSIDERARICHLIAHTMARTAVAKNPADWKTLFRSTNPDTCGGGLLHGILESARLKDSSFEINARLIAELCNTHTNSGNRISAGANTCAHSMGHLTLIETTANIAEAVRVCGDLEDQAMRFECYSGVFMETLSRENLVAHGLSSQPARWDAEDAQKLKTTCAGYAGSAAQACYGELTQAYTKISNHYPPAAYELCDENVPAPYRDFCYFKSAGRMAVDPGFQKQHLSLLCAPFTEEPDSMQKCIEGVISALINESHALEETAREFCNIIPARYRTTCLSLI